MRFPEYLPEGGCIGFVAPSFGCATEPYYSGFINAQKTFQSMGYSLELGPNCYESSGIGISNTPVKCGQELTEYYLKDTNDVLISCGGGELMCETLEYIDFEAIKAAKPKWYIGYSDNTNFTYLLATKCDVASIYGPCAKSFGMEPWHPAIVDAFDVICGKKQILNGYDKWERDSLQDEEHPLLPYNTTEKRILKAWKPEEKQLFDAENIVNIQFHGRLIGGCLDILINLLGTRFDYTKDFLERYKEDGIVWFIEACDLNVLSIRRAMWQMKQAGWFQYVKGFLIGRPRTGEAMMGLDQYEAVMYALSEYEVPVIFDLDIGHLPPMMPLIVGSFAEVTVNGNDIAINMKKSLHSDC